MYTFEDRGGRSLTLKPEATALGRARVPRARHAPRTAAPEALHRRHDLPLRGAAEGALPRALAGLGRGVRLDDPAVDAEVVHLYAEVLRRLGITRYVLELNSIGDPSCRPAYLEQLNRGSTRTPTARRGREAEHAAARCASSTSAASGCRRRCRTRPRSATTCATPAARTSRRCGGCSTCSASRTGHPDARAGARLLHAHRVRVPQPRGEGPAADLRAGAATTGSPPSSAGHRLRESASAPVSSGC